MNLNHKIIKNNEHNEWLVFLHGLGGNHNIFYKQVEYFSKEFNLLLIDLPGHGESMGTFGKETLTKSIEKINDLLVYLGIDKAHFMAVSLGTIVLQKFTLCYPEKINAIVLAGAVDKWKKWGYYLAKMAIYEPIKAITPYMLEYRLFAFILMPKNAHKKSRDIFIREAYKLGKRDYFNWVEMGMQSNKIYKQIDVSNNQIPKLYISGREDFMFLPGILPHVEKEANSDIYIIDSCGHVCNIEKADEFNKVAMEFLLKI